jgi:hypothetical protein
MEASFDTMIIVFDMYELIYGKKSQILFERQVRRFPSLHDGPK